jgi:hypothetical protein
MDSNVKRPKVFCIGFHKTGTTSLATALTTLGYRVTGPNGIRDPDIATNALPMALRLVEEFDAFQDNPWPVLFRQLDESVPGSRFILTLRPASSWIESQVRHFGKLSTPMREWIYGAGCPEGNEDLYLRRYDSHNREVLDYFGRRPQDLLVMELERGQGWSELCGFLGCATPSLPFPHENRAGDRKRRLQWLRRWWNGRSR